MTSSIVVGWRHDRVRSEATLLLPSKYSPVEVVNDGIITNTLYLQHASCGSFIYTSLLYCTLLIGEVSDTQGCLRVLTESVPHRPSEFPLNATSTLAKHW